MPLEECADPLLDGAGALVMKAFLDRRDTPLPVDQIGARHALDVERGGRPVMSVAAPGSYSGHPISAAMRLNTLFPFARAIAIHPLDGWSATPLIDVAPRGWLETDELGGLQFLEIRSSLPDELLMYGDKLSMAHGLEARVPYLDHEVVEYVERLPASFKVRWGSGKWLHRRLCSKLLPNEVVRRKKANFAANIVDGWFRESYDSKMEDILLNTESHIYGYLRPQAIQQLVKDHHSGWRDHHKILFSLVVLEEWLRTHV